MEREEGKQMGTVPWTVYAPTRRKQHWQLPQGLTWQTVELKVKRLQMRIAEAAKLKKYRRMRSLQWLLAHSFYGKLLAVKRVTSNKGKNTPGVDGVVWRTSRQKMRAVKSLGRHGYRARPLRRVYITKKSGKLRALGIPAMRDRAMQALHALALAPVAETWADPDSYGFREGRSCADAIEQCFSCLCQKFSAEWIFEADIKSCFDTISHEWIRANVPMDQTILAQWLKAGYMEDGKIYPTLRGTPQGGVISPLLMNMTLDGLERAVKKSVPYNIKGTNRRSGVCVIRYADDFVITAKTREQLEERVLPTVRNFLMKRGLSLSEEKTRIVHITQGFDFLGQNIRKYSNGKLIITPSRKALQGVQANVKAILKAHRGGDTWRMIEHLNQTIRGWCNYHRGCCASRAFHELDNWLFSVLKSWIHYRHPDKRWRWAKRKYFRSCNNSRWSFFASRKSNTGEREYRDLMKACRVNIIRHVKIRGEANPYDTAFSQYFANRKKRIVQQAH
jgi:RNA-directed DNA polymerase